MEQEAAPKMEKSPLEKFKAEEQYEKILADAVFLSQDKAGSRLKKYLFGSGIQEEEAVFVIVRYLLGNKKRDEEFPDDLANNQEKLETLLADQQAVNFGGNPEVAREYLRHMSDKLTKFILEDSLAEEKKAGENIMPSRIQSIKNSTMKEAKISAAR